MAIQWKKSCHHEVLSVYVLKLLTRIHSDAEKRRNREQCEKRGRKGEGGKREEKGKAEERGGRNKPTPACTHECVQRLTFKFDSYLVTIRQKMFVVNSFSPGLKLFFTNTASLT